MEEHTILVEGENTYGQTYKQEDSLRIEEGPLDDSENISLDLSVTTRFYNLQVEETVDQMSLASAQREREIGSYGDRIVFSPGGNEGYLFTNAECNLQEEDEMVFMQTPREVDDRMFLEQGGAAKATGAIMTQHPDEAYNSYDSSVITMSPRSGGQLTDRAASPSVASVTSLQSISSNMSITSNMSMTGRRYLEWDYGSDLGPQYQTQGEAAQSLSQLEKLAIGSYSEYLREEPDGGEVKVRQAQAAAKQDYLPDSEGEDMRANRFSKFADSLMRQRHLQQQERARQQRRSVSRERLRLRQETAPGEIPRQGREIEYQDNNAGVETVSSKSPVKSSSMSDIPQWATHIPKPSSRSTSTNSLAHMTHNLHMSGPSSSSSAGTVVAVQNMALPGMFGDLSFISTSPRSLPPHLQDMMVVTKTDRECDMERNMGSENVLVSQDVLQAPTLFPNWSLETVCPAKAWLKSDGEVFRGEEEERKDNEDEVDEDKKVCTGYEREETSLSTLEEDLCMSDKSDQPTPPDRPKIVWSQDSPVSNFQMFPTESQSVEEREQVYTSHNSQTRRRRVTQSSEPSSVPTTSDEEVDGPKQASLRLLPKRDYQGDTSTMESARNIDRAKSFEYIPGDSFPLQENSSSYEYLPGHLVTENRPPTVLTRRPESVPTQPSSVSNTDDQLRSRDNLALVDIGTDLDALSEELRGKSKELLAKNISQTKHFFKKLKGYIEFLSTPSLSVEDSRVKQELAGRIMALLSTEESRLGTGFSSGLSSRAFSSNSDRSRSVSQAASTKIETATRSEGKQMQPSISSRSKYSAPSTSSIHPLSKDLVTHSNNTNTGRNVSKEPSTRQLVRSPDSNLSAGEPAKDTSDQTSLSSEIKDSDNSSRLFDWKKDRTQSELEYQGKQKKKDLKKQSKTAENVEFVEMLQKKRLEQMKKLKKDIKKLEKLDTWIVGAAGGKVDTLSEVSLSSSVSTMRSETRSRTHDIHSDELEPDVKNLKRLKIPSTKTVEASSRHKASQTQKSKKEEKQPRAASLQIHKENYQKASKPVHSSRSASLTSTENREPDVISFGQTFPTPRPSDAETNFKRVRSLTTKTVATVTTSQHSVEIQTDRTVTSEDSVYTNSRKIKPNKNSPRKKRRSLPESVAKQKPVAYYLPMESLSPIRIGRRVLKEITGDTENIFYSGSNRNILSSYIASLDPQPLMRNNQPSPTVKKSSQTNKISLQEALFRKRKDFLKNCEERMAALSQAKDSRLLRSAKQTAWLEEIACQSPKSRRMAEPNFTPVPVVRVFKHRDMVRATREKYDTLPEIQNVKLDAKKTGKYRNNRLMSQIYSSYLQRKVVRGKVSFTHHQLVV